jgi:hypothetical protein
MASGAADELKHHNLAQMFAQLGIQPPAPPQPA